MDQELVFVVPLIGNTEVPKRHVTHNCVKEAVRDVCLFERLRSDRGALIKLLGDTGGNRVDFDSVHTAAPHSFGKHTDKMTDPAGRLQDVSFTEAHLLHSLVDCRYDNRRSVESCQNALSCRGILVRCKNSREFKVFRCPRRIVLIKCFRNTAPADIFRQNLLFFGCCEPVLCLTLFQKLDCHEVPAEPLLFPDLLNFICGKVKRMPFRHWDFRMEIESLDFILRLFLPCGCYQCRLLRSLSRVQLLPN